MKLVETSVKRPVGLLMIVLGIIAMGFVSLRSLAIDLFPEIELPIAVVATSYSGAAPEEVEKLISQPLEAAFGSVHGIDSISSQSQPGASLVVLMFQGGTNLDYALLEVREKVDQVRPFLPENANDPSVLRFNVNQLPVVQLGLSGADAVKLQDLAENTIIPYIERQDGVASVSAMGGKTREILIELDMARLASYGISASHVVQALNAENLSGSAGVITKGEQDLQVRIEGEYESLQDIANTLIHLPTGQQIQVRDVGNIVDTFKKQSSLTLVNGEEALVLSVMKQSDGNTVAVSHEVRKAVEQLQASLPEGVKLTNIIDTAVYIEQSVDSVLDNMITGAVLAVLVLLLFLRSFRTTIIIGVAIPIAVIAAFSMMYFSGQTLNVISMGGLALGVGMMVDNSIVILENIFTHRQRGASLKEAAIKGGAELAPAVIAATLTTVVVFLPMVFVEGIAADIFMPLGLTVSFTLLASLAVALTVVPSMSAKLLSGRNFDPEHARKPGKIIGFFNKFLNGYRGILKWVLGHRKTTVFSSIVLLIGSFMLTPFIGAVFFPDSDQGQIDITIELPHGTHLENTYAIASQVGELLEPYEEIIDVSFMSVGSSGGIGAGGGSNTAALTVLLVGKDERDVSTTQVMQELHEATRDIPGAEITVAEMQMALSGGSPIQISVNGPEQEVLAAIAEQVVWTISEIEGVHNATTSLAASQPELNIVIDRDVAAEYGLTFQHVMSQVQMSVDGQLATRYRESGNEYDVRVILPEDQRSSIADLTSLLIQTPTGQMIPLSTVADLKQIQAPTMIQRENQQRQVNISSDVVGRDLGSVFADVQTALASMNFPDGYSYSFGGQSVDMTESFIDLAVALVFSIFLVYVVMAVQFESLLFPFIIMFALPPTIIGVLFGLFITGTPLSMPAAIGVIVLAGIVVNNAIVLVDYINILRRQGMERREAILQAGPSRLRPIFMTTLTTVLGLVPLALGIGEGAELQAPMAIVVIFGLLFSTMITLLLVPVVYTILDDLSNWWKRLFKRKDKKKAQPTKEVTV